MRYLDATTDHAQSWALALEIARVRAHLRRVERDLRRRPVPSLSPEQRQARRRNLDALHAYWDRGLFPRNYDQPGKWVPCFIDRTGQACAVAQLMLESGAGLLAHEVAATDNNAYIADLDGPAFDAWVAESGLTRAELERIQPGYPNLGDFQPISAFLQSLALPILGLFGIALLSTSGNIRTYRQERVGWMSTLLGLLSGALLLYLLELFLSAKSRLNVLWRILGPSKCISGSFQAIRSCLDNPPLPAPAGVVAGWSGLLQLVGVVAVVVGSAGLLVLLMRRIAEWPRLSRWQRYGNVGVVAVALLALLLAQPIQLVRTRLPVFPGAQVQTIVDDWPYFRGEGAYELALQTTAAPQEVQIFYERAITDRGWIMESTPGSIRVTHYREHFNGHDGTGDSVRIRIEQQADGLTHVMVRQQHGTIYFYAGDR